MLKKKKRRERIGITFSNIGLKGAAFFPGFLIPLNPNFFHRLLKFSNTTPRLGNREVDRLDSVASPTCLFLPINYPVQTRYRLVTIHRPTTGLHNFSLQRSAYKYERMIQLFTINSSNSVVQFYMLRNISLAIVKLAEHSSPPTTCP